MRALWCSAYANFLAVVDVDAWGGGQLSAQRLSHQVVVVVVKLTRPLVGHHLVDSIPLIRVEIQTLVNNLTVFNDVAKSNTNIVRPSMRSKWEQCISIIWSINTDAFNDIK